MKPEEIRAWRLSHRLSQTALGRLLGVDYNTVYRWETGKWPYNEKMIGLAIRALEADLSITLPEE